MIEGTLAPAILNQGLIGWMDIVSDEDSFSVF
jgi:hypothetical protein